MKYIIYIIMSMIVGCSMSVNPVKEDTTIDSVETVAIDTTFDFYDYVRMEDSITKCFRTYNDTLHCYQFNNDTFYSEFIDTALDGTLYMQVNRYICTPDSFYCYTYFAQSTPKLAFEPYDVNDCYVYKGEYDFRYQYDFTTVTTYLFKDSSDWYTWDFISDEQKYWIKKIYTEAKLTYSMIVHLCATEYYCLYLKQFYGSQETQNTNVFAKLFRCENDTLFIVDLDYYQSWYIWPTEEMLQKSKIPIGSKNPGIYSKLKWNYYTPETFTYN